MDKFRIFPLGLVIGALVAVGGCRADSDAVHANFQEEPAMSQNVTELIKIDKNTGSGREAENGLDVTVHYTGWLYDADQPEHKGRKFDSSVDRRDPFTFNLGSGQVIQGWDQGVAGMKVGGARTLIIPPELGYGARGAGSVIPPNATLVFDVELINVR